ncbi:MAG: hypothetical protein WCK73_04380 [Deltaproteobacteria bacterium]
MKLDSQTVGRAAPWLGLVLLLAVTAVAYQPSLDGGFNLDDDRVVTWNPELRRPDAMLLPGLREMIGTGRPLTSVTLAYDLRDGLDPRRFHRTGLLLHLLATATVFLFLRRLLRRVGHARAAGVALVVTALFALHPIQMESAAYVSQRAEVLSAILYLGTLLLLDAAARRAWNWKGLVAWAGGVVGWIFAMAAKAVAMSLPGAFVAEELVLAPSGERGWGAARRRGLRAVLLSLPIAGLVAWSATLQFAAFEAMPSAGAGFTATSFSPWQYLLTQLRVQWLYLRLLAWPSALSIDRPYTASQGLDAPSVAAALGVAALVALAFWLWSRAERSDRDAPAPRLAAFGIFFWFIVLSPTSSVVPVLDLAVEHRVYLASLGPFLALGVAVDALLFGRLAPRAARMAAAALTLALLLPLGLTLASRAEAWSSSLGIWREAYALDPGSERIVVNLAIALRRSGDIPGAEATFQKAWGVVRKPHGVVSLSVNHGSLLIDLGRPAEALVILDRGVPYAPSEPGLRANRATALGMLNRNDEAIVDARIAATTEPSNPLFRATYGVALLAGGDLNGSLREFGAAEALDPGNPFYPVTAGIALQTTGRRDEACATYRRARATTKFLPLPRDAAARAAQLGCPIE